MLLSRFEWYKNRLFSMSGMEILWRVREVLYRGIDLLSGERLVAPLRDYGPLPEIPGLKSGLNTWDVPEDLLLEWKKQATLAQKGFFAFFGQEWPNPVPLNKWHVDPISGKNWPQRTFCSVINYRHAGTKGDIKFTWELNRLQYLQPMAALAFKTNDKDLSLFCLKEIESWIDHNPPFLGVNWSSGIELSLRLISILVVTTLIGEHLSRPQKSKIWSTLHTHGRWIARYPSLFSSANNHLTAEGLGLFVLGALCPHFGEAKDWKKTGWYLLSKAAELQILPDGVGAEQAPAYEATILEMLLISLKIANHISLPISDTLLNKISIGGHYLRWLLDEHGATPHIGDDDNSTILGAFTETDTYIASIVSAIATLLGRPDLSAPHTKLHFRNALFGLPLIPDFEPYGTRFFNHGGMAIGRHKNKHSNILLAFDCGYLGYLSIAAHGHADALLFGFILMDNQFLSMQVLTFIIRSNMKDVISVVPPPITLSEWKRSIAV